MLNWINNENLPLKEWVCNQIIEIRRLTDLSQWKHSHKWHDSKNGNKKGDKTADVSATFSH